MEEKKQQEQFIISILKNILGSPKQDRDGQKEFEFNCPSSICRQDQGKYNLWFNSKINIFQCWKCKYRGTVHKIVEDYGNKHEIDRLNLVLPKSSLIKSNQYKKDDTPKNLICKYPYGFKKLSWDSKSEIYKEAKKYLKNRRVDDAMIEKYNIGYIEEGYYENRVIVPSYNSNGELNYFVARAIDHKDTPTYKVPSKKKIGKDDIIFNESNVNFDLPVFLVEGVFDMFPLYNVVPLLGKFPAKPLIKKLLEHKSRVIICLDEDALRDGIELYNKLMSYGLDVYFLEVQQDLAKFYEDNGKKELIKLLQTHKKIDLQILLKLKLKDIKKSKAEYPETFLKEEWEKLKTTFEENSNK